MKQVRCLLEHEFITLEEAFKNHTKHRCRIRAHAVLSSYHGFSIKQIAQILLVRPDTVSSWIDLWLDVGISFLSDAKRTGRPEIYNKAENQRLKELVDEEPYQLKRAQSIMASKTGKMVSKSTIKRILKKINYSYKRARHSLKNKRDPLAFEACQNTQSQLIEAEARGRINLYYFDESGFSQKSNLPSAWSPKNEPLCLPAYTHSKRLNVLGFISRKGQLVYDTTEDRVTSDTVIKAFEKFIKTLSSDKITVVYVDNASMHRSAKFRDQCDEWLLKNVLVVYLPPYSPELNIIEILWKKIKYEWLSCHAYETFEKLTDSVKNILCNYPSKYAITFS